jgi:hypothetical protein
VFNFFICCVFYFLFLKLTGYDLIFKDFFKIQVNINLRSNIFDFSIWALSIAIGTKKILKIQKKQMSVKKCYNINKSKKKKKKKKKANFEKAVSGRLPISLTANH